MASAAGISVLGDQLLLVASDVIANVAVYIAEGSSQDASYAGYISLAVNNNIAVYQVGGMPLWYQGVWFPVIVGSGYPYGVVATWRKAGLSWKVDTF